MQRSWQNPVVVLMWERGDQAAVGGDVCRDFTRQVVIKNLGNSPHGIAHFPRAPSRGAHILS
jgi:hypothetical protein